MTDNREEEAGEVKAEAEVSVTPAQPEAPAEAPQPATEDAGEPEAPESPEGNQSAVAGRVRDEAAEDEADA